MSSFLQFIVNTYCLTLKLYSCSLRDEFAGEMHIVFRDSVVESAKEGIFPLTAVCVFEFIGLPFNILREFWCEIRGKEANMLIEQMVPMRPVTGSWLDSLLAGLPHLLIALIAGIIGTVPSTKLATVSGTVVALVFIVGFIATLYYTWRTKWAAWSASWYGYAALIVFIFAILPLQGWNPPLNNIFGRAGSLVLLLLSLAALLYWLSRRDPIEGLLRALPLIILYWLPVMELIPGTIRNWLTVEVFLIGGLTAAAITRINDIQRALWLVLGASISSGFPIALTRTY